jgi:hypothetical protein
MAPDHSEGFLKLVKDAKARIQEEDYRETKKRLDAGEKFVAPFTLAGASSSATLKRPSPTRARRSSCTVAVASARRSRPTICRRWAIAT